MISVVVDASVAVKWFLHEDRSDEAIRILEQDYHFIAPSFLKLEFDSVLGKWNRSGRLEISKSKEIRKLFSGIYIHYVAEETISSLAFEYSSFLPITFYDALYLSIAKVYNCTMVTYDKNLISAVAGTDLENHLSEP